MLVPWRSLNRRHKDSAMCQSGADKKRRRDTEAEIRESAERAFEAYGGQLESVSRFTYLGRVMTAGDDDSPTVAGNLKKSRKLTVALQIGVWKVYLFEDDNIASYICVTYRSVRRSSVVSKASNAASNFAIMSVEDVIVGVSYWLQRAAVGRRLGC